MRGTLVVALRHAMKSMVVMMMCTYGTRLRQVLPPRAAFRFRRAGCRSRSHQRRAVCHTFTHSAMHIECTCGSCRDSVRRSTKPRPTRHASSGIIPHFACIVKALLRPFRSGTFRQTRVRYLSYPRHPSRRRSTPWQHPERSTCVV
jgi:hypothetical protein